jgi:hypothetical protein
LSLGFPHPDCNEEEAQRQIAHQLGIPQVFTGLEEATGPQGLMRASLELTPSMPAPLVNAWAPGYRYLAQQAKERGCKVIVTGGGGDEWLTVSPYAAADMLRQLELGQFWRLWRSTSRSYRFSLPRSIQSIWWRYGIRPLLGNVGRSVLESVAPWAMRARRNRAAREQIPEWLAPDPAVRQMLLQRSMVALAEPRPSRFYSWEKSRSLDYPLVSLEYEETFWHGHQQGVPVLQPFLDVDLLELLYRTKPEDLNAGGRAKGLVRGMLARRFPGIGFERHKKVIATKYAAEVFGSESADAWKAVGGTPALAEIGVVDERLVNAEVERIAADRRAWSKAYIILYILGAELWVRSRI